MNIRILALALISLLAIACGDDENQESPTIVEGEWIWQYSVGGIAGSTITPETEDHTHKVEFEGNEFESYRDDEVIFESDFEIVKGKTIFTVDSVDVISYTNPDLTENYFEIHTDTLLLFDDYFDGFVHTYVKE